MRFTGHGGEASGVAQKAQVVRGMRDIVPPGAELRRRVTARVLDVYAGYGFEAIETPALEYLDVLMGSQGGDNEKLIFKVLRRGLSAEEQAQSAGAGQELSEEGLRFDLTVPLARFVANHLNELPMPFKVAQVAPVWRAERPQRGRYRQFTQCDIDIVGEPSVAAEVELCHATLDALEAIGVEGCTVRLNDRRVLHGAVAKYLGETAAQDPSTLITLDKLDKIGPQGVARELSAAGHESAAVTAMVAWLGQGDLSAGPTEAVEALGRTLETLAQGGRPAVFYPALVRGLGYYTGHVFEIWRDDLPYSLGGGGRYDAMAARFGAPALPMCGFSLGFERVMDLVDPALFATGYPKVAILCASVEELLACLGNARRKRAQDPKMVISVVRRARNSHKQQEDLRRLGYQEVVDGKEFAKPLP